MITSPLCESVYRTQVQAAGLHGPVTCPTRLFELPEKRMGVWWENNPRILRNNLNYLQDTPSQAEMATEVSRNSTHRHKCTAVLWKFQPFKYRQATDRHTLYRRLVHTFDAPLLTMDIKQGGNVPRSGKTAGFVFLHTCSVIIPIRLRSKEAVKLCAHCVIKQAAKICVSVRN